MISKHNNWIKTGSAFPASGKGVGLLLWFIILFFYQEKQLDTFKAPLFYFCFLVGLFLIISRKYLEIVDREKGFFKIRIGLGKISYGIQRDLNDYQYGLIQQGTWTQKIQQGRSLNYGKVKEKFTALFLIKKKENIKYLFYRGEKKEMFILISLSSI